MPGYLKLQGGTAAVLATAVALVFSTAGTAQDTAPAPPAAPESQDQADPATGEDQMSIGEVPAVETMELTPDIAKRALDAYVVVHEKYKDADIENYENLQDFVDQTTEGKSFDADIKAAGFASVNDWNLAITTETFVYANITEDQTADIKQQIEDVQADMELAQDMKDRMVKSLQAMIPSETNKKIVEELMKDPVYAEKLKTLEIVDE